MVGNSGESGFDDDRRGAARGFVYRDRKYEGMKLCARCMRYYPDSLLNCPVHGWRLRARPRNGKDKRKYLKKEMWIA